MHHFCRIRIFFGNTKIAASGRAVKNKHFNFVILCRNSIKFGYGNGGFFFVVNINPNVLIVNLNNYALDNAALFQVFRSI